MEHLYDFVEKNNKEHWEFLKKLENSVEEDFNKNDFRILDSDKKLKALSDNLMYFIYPFWDSLFTIIPDILTNKNISLSGLPIGRFVKEDSDQEYFTYETNSVLSPIEIKEELDKGKNIIIYAPKILDNDIKWRCFIY